MATHEDPKFEDEHGKLLRLAHNPNVNIPSVTALNLSNNKYRTVPPSLTLINFVNLRVISLSHNRIERFAAENLVLGAPLLEELDLSYNDMKTLDDIVELGSLQHLGVLTFLENPICKRYLRIKLIELLLFPSKYQVHDPVKLLTASYNIGLSKERTEKWQSLTNKNLVLRPRSESLDKKDSQKRIPKGISSNDLLRLTEEKCPVPRKTRFPELVTLNGEIISVSDMQSILATQNLASILPDGEVIKKVNKPVRFEKLHEKYIHSYRRKKERMRDDMNQIPTLQRIATIVGDDESGLKLMSYADHMRYGKRKNAKQDYEEQLWKMSGANKGIDDEFIIETIESDEEDLDESGHKMKSPKGAKAKAKMNKEHRTRKALKKKRWNRKDSDEEIQLEEESASSDSNLSERVSLVRRRMNKVESLLELSKEEEMCLLDLQEEKPNTSGDSLLEDSMHQRHERRSHSVTKFNKEKTQGKRVGFNPGSTVRDNKDDSPGSREVKLFGFRRAQTVAMGGNNNNNNNDEQRSFSEFSPRMRNTTRQETTQSEQEKPGKTYVVMRASTPNLSLARSTGTKSVVNIRMQHSDRESTSNKPPLSGQIIDIKKQKISVPNQEQSDSSPELSKDASQHRRTLTTEQISSTREESSGKHHYHKSMSSRAESHSLSKNKTHLFLQRVDGPGFGSIDEIKEIDQSGHNPISSISKASFLTPIKKFSQKTSFQQQSINGDFSSVATFPELSPKYAEKSPSKDINEMLKGSEPGSKQNHDDAISSTITNPLKYASRETHELKKSPVKAEKFHISDGKTYLKLLVAKKKAQPVKDHDRESRKLSQVIFLNRANATSYAKQQQEKRSSSISGMIQQQMQRQNQQSQHILIQQQQPQSQAQMTQQSQQKASDIINSHYTQENQIMFQKLFTQIVSQQKSFYSKFPGQNTDRPSFYFPKTQTSYVNTSNRFVISRSQQEQSSDLRSPEKTRLRTEEDGQGNASLSMTKRPTSSFMSRQSGQGKVKTKSVDRKEVAFSYGEVLDRGGKYGKLVKV